MTLFPPMTDARRELLRQAENKRRLLATMLNDHVCAECGAPLVMRSNLDEEQVRHWFLMCSHHWPHEGFRRLPSLSERYYRGEALPLHIVNRIEARRRHDMEEELSPEQQRALTPYHGVRTLTQKQATDVLRTIWPTAPDLEVLKAAILCRDYGLHPLMRHVFLIPFRTKVPGTTNRWEVTWSTVMGIDATRLIASRRGAYSYFDGPRLMTDEEQMRLFGEVDKQNIWAVTVLQDAAGNRAPGYGNWPKDKEPHGTEKGNTKARMSFIRSERDALRRLRPGELPTGVDVVDPSYLPSTGGESEGPVLEAPPEVIDVDPDSGEVREKDSPPEHVPSAPTDVTNSEPAPPHLSCVNDLTKAAHERYDLQPKQVYEILGISSAVEVGPDLEEAWAKIVASQE